MKNICRTNTITTIIKLKTFIWIILHVIDNAYYRFVETIVLLYSMKPVCGKILIPYGLHASNATSINYNRANTMHLNENKNKVFFTFHITPLLGASILGPFGLKKSCGYSQLDRFLCTSSLQRL